MNIRRLVFAAALGFAGQALAQVDCLKAPEPAAASAVRGQITLKRAQFCYDIRRHTPPALKPAVEMLDKADKEQRLVERRATVVSLFDAMRQWAETGVSDPAVRTPLQRSLQEAGTAVAQGERSKPIVDPTGWRIVHRPSDDALVSNVSGNVNLMASIDAACTGAQERCNAAIRQLETVLRTHSIAEVALVVARKEELSDFADLFTKRAAMWEAYRTEARPQYPWEWLLNSALYTDDRPRYDNKNPIGPANLPKGQWIALHPGVGLERFDIRGTDQAANNATLYVEWVGYNRLDWDYDAGKLRGGLGVSLVSVYASRQDAKDWSHGVMFWSANKYGLAVTRNSMGTSLMLSVDLGELIRDQLNQWNKALKADFPPK